MTAYEKLKTARLTGRPTGKSYVDEMFTDKIILCGDRRYGSAERDCEIALWSASVEFIADGRAVNIKKIPPNAYPWRIFGDTEFYEKTLEGGF